MRLLSSTVLCGRAPQACVSALLLPMTCGVPYASTSIRTATQTFDLQILALSDTVAMGVRFVWILHHPQVHHCVVATADECCW